MYVIQIWKKYFIKLNKKTTSVQLTETGKSRLLISNSTDKSVSLAFNNQTHFRPIGYPFGYKGDVISPRLPIYPPQAVSRKNIEKKNYN